MKSAIRVENLSKQYHLGARSGYRDLRETLVDGASALWGGLTRRQRTREEKEEFWALKDVSFDVAPGEVIGIIGRNGAGKSTLLKILSRIVEPTRGRTVVRGRMSSLLEVGTGFHPDLTGRENVYLNGSILGMSRREIDRKFDEIVAFSEIERFLDTPVKRYSSGMYVRLAFAVAAHMEPEILIVDEVLAVGDTSFQEKCLGKMGDVVQQGRTILFVSHNMTSIRQLCGRSLLLKGGRVSEDGPTGDVIQSYYKDVRPTRNGCLRDWPDRDTDACGRARVIRLDVWGAKRELTDCVDFGDPLLLTMVVEFAEPVEQPTFGVLIHSAAGEPILDLRSVHGGLHVERAEGIVRVEMTLPNLGLYPGEYHLSPWVADHTMQRNLDWVKHARVLLVSPAVDVTRDLQRDAAWGKYWVATQWSCEAAV